MCPLGLPTESLLRRPGAHHASAFTAAGKTLATASHDRKIALWDGHTGAPLAVLPGHTAEVWSVAYTPDGKSIVSVSNNSVVRLWDTRLIERDGIFRGHTKFVYGVAYHPDGELATKVLASFRLK